MDSKLQEILETLGTQFENDIQKGSRHYLETNIGDLAGRLGYEDLKASYRDTYAVIPLKTPRGGMKVRIDGRAFAEYAEYDSGVVVPGYLARQAGGTYKTFVPNDSMICNYA